MAAVATVAMHTGPFDSRRGVLLLGVILCNLDLELLKELLDCTWDAVRDGLEVLAGRLKPNALEALGVQRVPVVYLLTNATRAAVVVQVHKLRQVVVNQLSTQHTIAEIPTNVSLRSRKRDGVHPLVK